MIELGNNRLTFRFPEVHPKAVCGIEFQRTLRIPDDNREYYLPPGLGRFPVEHVDDFAERLPETWRQHGGVFVPLYQAEALWINFSGDYPCAVKIAAGKINAVSGKPWRGGLSARPQDYVVLPEQPWLDGFNVAQGLIRQFVAMPLGEGYTAEEQLTGTAEHGGLQLIAYPMKAEVYRRLFEERKTVAFAPMQYGCPSIRMDMGLAPGGLMRQEIYKDHYGIDAWDQAHGARCFVHLVNSAQYAAVTGHAPPHEPPTAKQYTDAGLPWFDYYADGEALPGSPILRGLTSLAAKMFQNSKGTLPDNEPVTPKVVKTITKTNLVREGDF